MAIQYWRQRDRYYRLIGTRCTECGAESFPPAYRCKKCGSEKLEDKEMPQTGKIVTYTQLHEPLPGFEAQAPFYIAVVKLDNGARVLTQIVDSPDDTVKTGAKVRATVRRARVDGDSGQIIYGYKFSTV
ncbi:MAG: Zn-ribbon domain-containing OB-fold protein [Nitrososphaerota archaeon]|nr:Zn-ribbon domain-containing OB-fold protein [Nitrososphaerota archaeon]MDG7016632.1 Zn-ribbon domain-containing OB-fold protein [Nitrososphaerota archaeon]